MNALRTHPIIIPVGIGGSGEASEEASLVVLSATIIDWQIAEIGDSSLSIANGYKINPVNWPTEWTTYVLG